MNDDRAAALACFGFLFSVASFIFGNCAMGWYWQAEIVRQGKAHYTVDPQTGSTELVWSNK